MNELRVNAKIQKLNGKAARRIGQHYNVYRLSNTSNGSVLNSGNRILTNFPIRMVLNMEGWIVEQTKIYDMVFEGLCDARNLQIGDICVEMDGDGAMFAVADLRPMNPNVFIRVEQSGALSRPFGALPNGATQMPSLGRVGFFGAGKSSEQICVLINGYYSLALSGNPATIPLGVQPYKRLGMMPDPKVPTSTHRNEVFAYVPNLPGVQIQPGDVISASNGDRYQVHTVTPYTEGLQGYQLICESLFI